MKLEKFDYQIGNKKTKREFVVLGVLCVALIITVVLYKTFASFSSSASYNIVSSVVGNTAARNKVVEVNISKEGEGNEVYATLYDDNTLSINGTGEMKDFDENVGTDLIGVVLDAYLEPYMDPSDNLFTAEEKTFINDHKKFMYTMFDYAARSFLARDESKITSKIAETFVDGENNPVAADIELATSVINKVKGLDFDVDAIEIVGDVKNIGKNAFSLVNATDTSDIRENFYTEITDSWAYNCTKNTVQTFNLFSLESDVRNTGDNAMLDINAQNINIGSEITWLPDNIFASYNGGKGITCSEVGISYHANNVDQNLELVIPANITNIGDNAFYAYDGKSITFEERTERIDSFGNRAFANFNGSEELHVPFQSGVVGHEIFRDFTGKAYIAPSSSCVDLDLFFPSASQIYANGTLCSNN